MGFETSFQRSQSNFIQPIRILGFLLGTVFFFSVGTAHAEFDRNLILKPGDAQLDSGKKLYQQNCVACHGDTGMGNGPAGGAMNPKPRNFTSLSGWTNGTKYSDMFKTLDEGIPARGMAAFNWMPAADRINTLHYIRKFASGYAPVSDSEVTSLVSQYKLDEMKVASAKKFPIWAAIELTSVDGNLAQAISNRKLPLKTSDIQAEMNQEPSHVIGDGDAKRGMAMFKQCSSCHGQKGEGNLLVEAPAIAGLPEWYILSQLKKFKHGVRGKHPKDIAGIRMRSMGRTLSVDDLYIVARTVSQMQPAVPSSTFAGDIEAGKASYQTCAACHGVDGKGNQGLGAPPLLYSNDWYLKQQLKNFKAGIRGADSSLDPVGATMVPMAGTLADETAMNNVITYIQSTRGN